MKTEKENFIQIKKTNILRIGINDEFGNDTGEHLEFDLNDIQLPLKINKCNDEHKRLINKVKMQIKALENKEDKKGKYLLSWKQEEEMKILNEFYEEEMKILDKFLGENGCKKLLNGRNPYYTMFDDFKEMLEPIFPLLEKNAISLADQIKNKYGEPSKEGKVIE